MHSLARSLQPRNDLGDDLALLRGIAIARDFLKQTTHLQGIPAKNGARPTEYGPALLGLESLHGPQLIEHGDRQTEHRAAEPCIDHSLRRQILHVLDLKSVGIAQDNALPQSLALPGGRGTPPLSLRLLLSAQSLTLSVLDGRDTCLFLRWQGELHSGRVEGGTRDPGCRG